MTLMAFHPHRFFFLSNDLTAVTVMWAPCGYCEASCGGRKASATKPMPEGSLRSGPVNVCVCSCFLGMMSSWAFFAKGW